MEEQGISHQQTSHKSLDLWRTAKKPQNIKQPPELQAAVNLVDSRSPEMLLELLEMLPEMYSQVGQLRASRVVCDVFSTLSAN